MHIREFLESRRLGKSEEGSLTESNKSKMAFKRLEYAKEAIRAAEREDRDTVARAKKEEAAQAALMAVKDIAMDMGMKGALGAIRKAYEQIQKESRS